MTNQQKLRPTAEQDKAVELFKTGKSLVIEAGAGAGKTSTLKLLALNAPTRKGQYIAFNKAIVTEAGAKMPRNVACSTAHSLAYRNIVSRNPWMAERLRTSRRMKSSETADRLGIDRMVVTTPTGERKNLSRGYLAGLAMRSITRFCQTADAAPGAQHVPYIDGIDLPRHYDNNREVARYIGGFLQQIWDDLTSEHGAFPFKHDHYLKLWQLSSPRINADFILFDEAQDANPVLVDIVRQQQHAQLVWVGDSQQQIYTFTGAVNALQEVGAEQETFLTQSFRFGPAVADVANRVLAMLPDAKLRLVGTDSIPSTVEATQTPDVILCRTNARAVRNLLDAIAAGKRPHIVGGGRDVVDFAKGARGLMNDGFTAHPELACFESWTEVQTYVEQDEQGGELRLMVSLVDEFGVDVILDALENMPTEESADVVISTAHKSKGREWNAVQLADDFPAEPKGEELRLLYVAVTRAKLVLDVTNIKLLAGGFTPPATPVDQDQLVRDMLESGALVASVVTDGEVATLAPAQVPDDKEKAPVTSEGTLEAIPSDAYRRGVVFIALNDEPDDLDADNIAGYISTTTLSETLDVDADRIARDVVQYRKTGNLGHDRNGDWLCSCGRKIHGNAAAASHMKAHRRRGHPYTWVTEQAVQVRS